jgi:hypothetical protein
VSGDHKVQKSSWLDIFYSVFYQPARGLDAMKIVRREFENRNEFAGKILLITNVLIGSYEQIKLGFGSLKQLAVSNTTPSLAWHTGAEVPS